MRDQGGRGVRGAGHSVAGGRRVVGMVWVVAVDVGRVVEVSTAR